MLRKELFKPLKVLYSSCTSNSQDAQFAGFRFGSRFAHEDFSFGISLSAR